MNKYFLIVFLLINSSLIVACAKSSEMMKKPISRDYNGLTVEQAQALADSKNVKFRVAKQDGEEFGLTMDFILGRINAIVENGIVTSYNVEGENMSPSTHYDQNSWITIIDNSCQSFFDGCNICRKIAGDSQAVACTRKMCKNSYEKPKCLDN